MDTWIEGKDRMGVDGREWYENKVFYSIFIAGCVLYTASYYKNVAVSGMLEIK